MAKLEVFFDYACPYCLRAYEYLMALLPQHPDIEVVWRPCEAHPRPETYGPHTDLCVRGMFYARDHGVNLEAYHQRIFAAALTKREDIEDPEVIAKNVSTLMDADALATALREGAYEAELAKANAYAYEESGVWAVPAYRMGDRKLDAVENVGVKKSQLQAFLDGVE